jgi:hypothetical protein
MPILLLFTNYSEYQEKGILKFCRIETKKAVKTVSEINLLKKNLYN